MRSASDTCAWYLEHPSSPGLDKGARLSAVNTPGAAGYNTFLVSLTIATCAGTNTPGGDQASARVDKSLGMASDASGAEDDLTSHMDNNLQL